MVEVDSVPKQSNPQDWRRIVNPNSPRTGGGYDPGRILVSKLLKMFGGVFLIAAAIFIFLDARSQIDETPLTSSVVYMQALTRLGTVGAISIGLYFLGRTVEIE